MAGHCDAWNIRRRKRTSWGETKPDVNVTHDGMRNILGPPLTAAESARSVARNWHSWVALSHRRVSVRAP